MGLVCYTVVMDIWQIIERIGAITAIITLPYLVLRERRNIQKFSYDFSGSSGRSHQKDGHEYYKFTFDGTIKNHSLSPNSINKIYMVVWKDHKKQAALRFGYGHYEINDSNGNALNETMQFEPREVKKLTIVNDSLIEGTSDEKLLGEMIEVIPGSKLLMHKHQYELAFEDSSGKLFDQNGKLLNRKLIDLNWTLENTFAQLKDGKYGPFIKHKFNIVKEKLRLRAAKFTRFFGLSN